MAQHDEPTWFGRQGFAHLCNTAMYPQQTSGWDLGGKIPSCVSGSSAPLQQPLELLHARKQPDEAVVQHQHNP